MEISVGQQPLCFYKGVTASEESVNSFNCTKNVCFPLGSSQACVGSTVPLADGAARWTLPAGPHCQLLPKPQRTSPVLLFLLQLSLCFLFQNNGIQNYERNVLSRVPGDHCLKLLVYLEMKSEVDMCP